MLLPYSQRFLGGYIAFNRPEFVEFFAEHHVQVPLRNGDAVFFNPALYHGAGSNVSTDIRRMANLLQISSPFGRAMEALDRTAMVRAVYPALLAMKAAGRSQRDLHNVVVATAEGYPFPTNLDLDQPIGSLAPPARSTPCWPRWPTTSPPNNSMSRCATRTIGEFHDHTRRDRTGPHRRLPHRHPQRPGQRRRSGDHRRAARTRRRSRRETRCHTSRFGRGAAVLGHRRSGGRGGDAGPCRADTGRRRTRNPHVLREADRRDRRGKRPGRRRHRPLRRAGAGRLPAPLRRRVRRGQTCRRRRFARPPAHGAQHDDGSRAAADGVHRRFRRHLPRLRGARLRRIALDHRAAGRRGLCHRQRAGRSAVHRIRRRRHRRRGGDVRVGHPRRDLGGPVQRPRLRLPPRGARLPRHRRRRLGPGRTGAKRRSRQRVSRRPGAPLLHGPLHRGVPGGAGGVRRRRERQRRTRLHRRGRGRGGLARRGGDRVVEARCARYESRK